MLSEILGGAEPSPDFLADLGLRALRDAYNRTVGRDASVPGTAAPPSPEQTARVAQMRQPMQRPQPQMPPQAPAPPQQAQVPQDRGLLARAEGGRTNMNNLGAEKMRLQRIQGRLQGHQQQAAMQRQNEMMRLQREQQVLGGGNRQVFGQGPYTPFDTSAQFGGLGQRGV
tara:strand:+ start:3573 stop:4082 length:510 start_codon:yes stop_codon:yes gene_type:complete